MIWSSDLLAEFCFTTSSFDSLCMNDSTSNRICLFETIRIVDSSSICWLRIESFYNHSIEMISFRSTDFSKLSRDQWIRRWICDSDEIRSKWQRRTKMSWSEEKNLRDKRRSRSSDEPRWIRRWRSVDRWMRGIFYIMSWISHSF
jgi:hypothetical protein